MTTSRAGESTPGEPRAEAPGNNGPAWPGFVPWCRKHWPVVFAFVGIMPMAAFNFAISALAFNANSHGYGTVFLISGLAVWATPPAAVWLAIRKWVG